MRSSILVVGASGMLGAPVARQLRADGWPVRVLTRSPERARARLGDGYELVTGDVERPVTLVKALQGCQGVHISLDGKADPDLERRGAEAVVQAAQKAGVERITYLSGASVCEENCWYPGTKAKYDAERALIGSGIAHTIFRAHYFMETLPNFVRGRLALVIGRHPHPYPWVAAEDYARMVARAYAMPEAANKILYICGPQALTMRQALGIFCRAAHPEARLAPFPIPLAVIVARLGSRRDLQAALPFFRYCEQVRIILSGSPEEANCLLGAPQTTLEEWSRHVAAQKAPAALKH